MKYIFFWIAILMVLIILLPLCLNVAFVDGDKQNTQAKQSAEIDVYIASSGKVAAMEREEYILGVLMAEMPAEFELEALKAQAVAARTYMAQKMKSEADADKHKGASVCTDSSHCQAYVSEEEAKIKWGKNASLYFEKCKKAVSETQDIIAVYKGEPIKAVFHAIAGGRTENACDVWGTDVAYLRSVESKGDALAPKYETSVEIPMDEFKKTLSEKCGVSFENGIIGEITRSEGGTVATVCIGDKLIKGTQIRTLFSLRSAYFDIIPCENSIVFNVRGYGHGVGMSQYGANYCAKEGMTYDKILTKYYSGIEFAYLE